MPSSCRSKVERCSTPPDLVLLDLRDRESTRRLLRQRRPEVIFHAAALKHLPLLERFPGEAVQSNVWLTAHLLAAAADVGVNKFVNISTDKAADPTSVLGYSKRIAERLTAHYAEHAAGSFVSVRFGNVLGSRGSVLHAFRAQIEAGGPVTVTDPEVSRYFMTVHEAVQLVIQAAAVNGEDRCSGEALVLDMGEPVLLDDVARRLIAESGRAIDVVYTGLRPGEKLHEALFGEDEQVICRVHRLISHVRSPPLDPDTVKQLDLGLPAAALIAELRKLSLVSTSRSTVAGGPWHAPPQHQPVGSDAPPPSSILSVPRTRPEPGRPPHLLGPARPRNVSLVTPMCSAAIKRTVDVAVAATVLTLSLPVLAVVAALVRLQMGGPVLFRQARLGRYAQSFKVVKFRTMTDERDGDGQLLPDNQRLTRLGRLLRALSLDELPQLWNVLRGEMSLVGPRPLPVTYVRRYTPAEHRRHTVRPGLTGWAQVNGRNDVGWEERFALDVWYVDHRSLWLDVRVVSRTVMALIRRNGISAQGQATMTELRPPAPDTPVAVQAEQAPAEPSRIWLSPPDVRAPERASLLAALESGWVAPVGPDLDAFEAELAERCGVPHAVALSSGTAALHLALLQVGVGLWRRRTRAHGHVCSHRQCGHLLRRPTVLHRRRSCQVADVARPAGCRAGRAAGQWPAPRRRHHRRSLRGVCRLRRHPRASAPSTAYPWWRTPLNPSAPPSAAVRLARSEPPVSCRSTGTRSSPRRRVAPCSATTVAPPSGPATWPPRPGARSPTTSTPRSASTTGYPTSWPPSDAANWPRSTSGSPAAAPSRPVTGSPSPICRAWPFQPSTRAGATNAWLTCITLDPDVCRTRSRRASNRARSRQHRDATAVEADARATRLPKPPGPDRRYR